MNKLAGYLEEASFWASFGIAVAQQAGLPIFINQPHRDSIVLPLDDTEFEKKVWGYPKTETDLVRAAKDALEACLQLDQRRANIALLIAETISLPIAVKLADNVVQTPGYQWSRSPLSRASFAEFKACAIDKTGVAFVEASVDALVEWEKVVQQQWRFNSMEANTVETIRIIKRRFATPALLEKQTVVPPRPPSVPPQNRRRLKLKVSPPSLPPPSADKTSGHAPP